MKTFNANQKSCVLSLFLAIAIALNASQVITFADTYHRTPENATNAGINDAPETDIVNNGIGDGTIPEYNETNANKSERRLKYEQLLMGNYYAPELINKFHDLFGSDYSAQYIRENYTEIFDVDTDEIDEGFLNIIANTEYSEDIDEYFAKRDDSTFILENGIDRITMPGSIELPTPSEIVIAYPEIIEWSGAGTHDIVSSISQDFESRSEQREIFNSVENLDAVPVYDLLSDDAASVDEPGQTRASSNAFNSITLVSKSSTTVTFDIWYSNNSEPNNYLKKYNKSHPTNTWETLLGGSGKPAAHTRRYIADNLIAGAVYKFVVTSYDWGTSSWVESDLTVQTTGVKAPSVTKVSSSTTSFTVKATFPSEGAWGNILEYWNGITWVDVTGQGTYSRSGNYMINGVIPGKKYYIS